MKRKNIFFIIIFLTPFFLFCQKTNGVTIIKPDIRDSSYSFIGEWKITETFKLDPQWAADIYDPKIAEAIIGKEIVYRNESAIFQNKEYHIRRITANSYYNSKELKKATTGSGVKSYNFKDLHISEDIQEIRKVVILFEEDEVGISIFGRTFFVVDSETMLIHWLGWIFKAERVK